jgi:hypothetical protein
VRHHADILLHHHHRAVEFNEEGPAVVEREAGKAHLDAAAGDPVEDSPRSAVLARSVAAMLQAADPPSSSQVGMAGDPTSSPVGEDRGGRRE